MHRIVVLALPGVIPFELGIPSRIFGAARDSARRHHYEVITCSLDGQPVRTQADYGITVDHDARILATADTVVIAPTHELGTMYGEGTLPEPLRAALALIRPGTRLVAICTGSFVLAAAGLLDGRPATTHWRYSDQLARVYPAVKVDADVLYVDDGDILTSAGVAAGLDLCLHLVRRDHGSAVANQVARSCVVPPARDGGQAQYIQRPVPAPSEGSTSAARQWALERLDQHVSLADLAGYSAMSTRTFTRRFRAETGLSPGQWLIRQRVDLARHLLETTGLAIDQVAARAGFGTATSLRQNLQATIGISPSAYRHTFQPNQAVPS
ncbi:MAG: helix-turn-helix domain-containing protein [Streptosporangiaceae bacterium]